MLYIVGRKDGIGKILFVKVDDGTEFEERMKLKEGEIKLGCITDEELNILRTNPFAVISS